MSVYQKSYNKIRLIKIRLVQFLFLDTKFSNRHHLYRPLPSQVFNLQSLSWETRVPTIELP